MTLDIKILKCIKLITINVKCCNMNSIKSIESIKNRPLKVLQVFRSVWIMHKNMYFDRSIGLVL
jgi:hypothetical protein